MHLRDKIAKKIRETKGRNGRWSNEVIQSVAAAFESGFFDDILDAEENNPKLLNSEDVVAYMKEETMKTFSIGDRVKKADINADSIPAYASMRGTVVQLRPLAPWNNHTIGIQWDCDPKGMPPVWADPVSIEHAEE